MPSYRVQYQINPFDDSGPYISQWFLVEADYVFVENDLVKFQKKEGSLGGHATTVLAVALENLVVVMDDSVRTLTTNEETVDNLRNAIANARDTLNSSVAPQKECRCSNKGCTQ